MANVHENFVDQMFKNKNKNLITIMTLGITFFLQDEELQIKIFKNFKHVTKSHYVNFHVEWNVNNSNQSIW
jgi:hypothetical protein